MTIDVQLGEMGHGLLGSNHLSTINQTELAMGLGGEALEQPLSATPSPAGSLLDEDMDDFKVRGYACRLKESNVCVACTDGVFNAINNECIVLKTLAEERAGRLPHVSVPFSPSFVFQRCFNTAGDPVHLKEGRG